MNPRERIGLGLGFLVVALIGIVGFRNLRRDLKEQSDEVSTLKAQLDEAKRKAQETTNLINQHNQSVHQALARLGNSVGGANGVATQALGATQNLAGQIQGVNQQNQQIQHSLNQSTVAWKHELAALKLVLPLAPGETAEARALAVAVATLGPRGDLQRDEKNPDKIVALRFLDMALSNAELAHLKHFKHLELLELKFCRFSSDGLAPIAELKNLRSVDFEGSKIDDAGLAHVKDLKQLTQLVLDDTRITDKGLSNLEGLTKLVYLSLERTGVTEQGYQGLRKMLPKAQITWSR